MVTLRKRVVGFVVALIVLLSVSLYYRYQIQNTLSYASRPLWDHPDGPKHVIPHYWAPGLEPTEEVCKLHGNTLRTGRESWKEVWDAVLLSTELDLLEIRMNELDSVVNRFFIIESDRTFTGIPKPTYFKDALSSPRFARFSSKITYALHPGRVPKPGESPFAVEKEQRQAMTKLISDAAVDYDRQNTDSLTGSPPSPILIMSDVDEIPSAHTIKLIKKCEFPSKMHLQLQNYVYSFEWPSGWGSWRAQVQDWDYRSVYMHSMATDVVLADAGWHCSFCFRTIEEFVTKMRGYSHADRIGGDLRLLEPKRIQETICSGKDIFNMLPEAYTYKEMFQLMNPEPSKSAVGLPRHVLEHAGQFGYLLPGGCNRSRAEGSK